MRGWSLNSFMELTSWPRDADSGMNTRFGLPSIDDIDPDDIYDSDYKDKEQNGENLTDLAAGLLRPSPEARSKAASDNPFVLDLDGGIKDLNQLVLSKKMDCVLFLTAPWCRTCKTMIPGYTRFARQSKDKLACPLIFAKADAVGKDGKELGRRLGVDSVPTFVIFRKGRRYGTNLSVSKFPSKKLEKAVAYLVSGRDWDQSQFEE